MHTGGEGGGSGAGGGSRADCGGSGSGRGSDLGGPFPLDISLIRVISSGSITPGPTHSLILPGHPSGSLQSLQLILRHQLALTLLSCGFHYQVKVRREPLGVVALITPWNYPLLVGECGVECVGTSLKLLNPEP